MAQNIAPEKERGRKAPLPLSLLTVDKEGEILATLYIPGRLQLWYPG
jgi:hypothetical protein